jgi:hypothetical protein
MNKIPNEEENKKLCELFIAIYFNDIEKVIDFKNRYPELYPMKNNFQTNEMSRADGKEAINQSFDLINLTFFNQSIWRGDGWRDESKVFAERRHTQTLQMLDFWRTELGRQEINRTVEYNQFWNCFYCEDPAITDEIGVSEPIQDYVGKGYREIDLMLYNRAECFDFIETKKLLELGANPDITFYETKEDEERDDGYNILDRIGSECSYLLTCQIWFRYELFDKGGYPYFDIDEMFSDLLGLAAHEEMYDLLKPYSKNQ